MTTMRTELQSTIARVHRYCMVEIARDEMRDAMDRRWNARLLAASVMFFVVCLVLR
jgi:hypothetical protein